MSPKEFDILINEIIERSKEKLKTRSKEYASDTDKLHNFKVAGRKENESPEKALMGMKVKHTVSLGDMVNEIEKKCSDESNCFPAYEPCGYIKILEEKITDEINYWMLLELIIKERYKKACLNAGF